MPPRAALLLITSIVSLSACDMSPAPSAARAPAAAPSVKAGEFNAKDRLGAPISAPEVTLAEIAKNPAGFEGRPFTARGTVTAVCQEMGCWMEMTDASTGAHMRMHGHAFYIPKSASGRRARVQATLLPGGQMANACSDEGECASKDKTQLQLDATGVELD